jgi:hypothetical protein
MEYFTDFTHNDISDDETCEMTKLEYYKYALNQIDNTIDTFHANIGVLWDEINNYKKNSYGVLLDKLHNNDVNKFVDFMRKTPTFQKLVDSRTKIIKLIDVEISIEEKLIF